MKIHLPFALRRVLITALGAVSFTCSAAGAEMFVVEGVDVDNVTASTRFYDTGKGYYWDSFSREVSALYSKTGSYSFLGDLTPYLKKSLLGPVYGGFDRLSDDSDTCWRQSAANLIQYWLGDYGVFYAGKKELPYGYTYSTEYLERFGGTQSLKVSMVLFDNSWNTGGTLDSATDWFFSNLDDRWMITNAGYKDGFGVYFGNSSTDEYLVVENVIDLTAQIAEVLGYDTATHQVTTKGRISYLGLTSTAGGHAITCYGFETNEDGSVKALYVCNSDDSEYCIFKVYLKMGSITVNGKNLEGPILYSDEACTTAWKYAGTTWLLDSVSCINTPDCLKTMLSQYESGNLVWNGGKQVWSSTDGVDPLRLPDSSDGWQVEADSYSGSGYAGKAYYPSFYHPDRNVEFGDAAFTSGSKTATLTVDGAVSAAGVVLSPSGGKTITFNGANNASITCGDMSFTGAGTGKFSKVSLKVTHAVTVDHMATLHLSASSVAAPSLTIASGSTLVMDGSNTLTGNLVFASGSSIQATLAGKTPVLSVSGTLSVEGAVSFSLPTDLSRGRYVFGTFKDITGDVEDINVSGLTTLTEWLWEDGTLTLSVGVSHVDFPVSGGVWQDGVGNFYNDAEQRVNFCGGTITINGQVTPSSIVVDGAKDTVWNSGSKGSVAGAAKLTKSGAGKLTINTANTFTGGATIKEGTLVAGDATAFGSGKVELQGGTLDLGGYAVPNDVSATGGTLSNATAYKGALVIAGNVALGGTTTATGLTLNSGTLSGGSIRNAPVQAVSGTISSAISGTSSVVSSGAVTLSGGNSYTGATTVTDGTLTAGGDSAFGTGTVALQAGTLNLGGKALSNKITATGGKITNAGAYKGALTVKGSVTLGGTTRAGGLTMSGGTLSGGSLDNTPVTATGGTISSVISGSSSVNTSGSVTLAGANSYTGGTTVTAGTLTLKNAKALGSGAVVLQGGRLDATSVPSLTWGALEMGGGTLATKVGGVTVSGELSLTGDSIINLGYLGAGDYTVLSAQSLSGSLDQLQLELAYADSYSWSYSGDKLMLHLSTATLASDATVWDSSKNGQSMNFTQADSVYIAGEVKPAKMDVNCSGDISWAGSGCIAGSAALVKDGAGTLTIGSSNSFSGGTTIKNGTLSVAADGALGTGGITLAKGTLALNGHKLPQNSLLVSDTATVRGGDGGEVASTTVRTPGLTDSDGTLLFGGVAGMDGSVVMDKLVVERGNVTGGSVSVREAIQASSGTVSANLSGTARFVKQDKGSVLLKGRSSWTGNTEVKAGRLVFAGAANLPGTLRTYTGSTLELRSTAVLGDLTLGGGTLVVGRSAPLTVTGTLSLTSVTVLDTASLGSGITINFGTLSNTSGLALDEFFGVQGKYTVTNSESSLVFRTTQTAAVAADLQEGAEPAEVEEPAGEEPVADAAPAVPAVQAEPAASLSSLAQSTWGTARAARLFSRSVRDHDDGGSAVLDAEGTRSAWFSAISCFSRTTGNETAAGADANIFGGVVGMQFNGAAGGDIGLAIGQTCGRVMPTDGAPRVDQQTQHAALYGTKMLISRERDNAWLTATCAYATTDSDSTQEGRKFEWSQHSTVLGLRGAWVHRINGATSVYGYAGAEYLATDAGGTENGSSGSLQELLGELGAGVRYTAGRLTLNASAAISPSLVRNKPVAESDGLRGGVAAPGRFQFQINAGAVYKLSERWNASAGYSCESARHESSHSVNVGASYTF